MQIQDLCKERRQELRMSNPDIAEYSEVPLSTVNNFFSNGSKCPSVYTVGPICKALGVSLDEFFGIQLPKPPVKDKCEDCCPVRADAEKATQLETINKLYADRIRFLTHVVFGLLIICTLILIYAIFMDALNSAAGIIQQ